jgi:hypothetical protein
MGAAAARQASQVPITLTSGQGPQRLDAELVQGAAGLDVGAGHQHVEPAVPGQYPVDQVCYGALAGDVAGLAADGAPGPGGQPGGGVGAAGRGPAGQHDIGAGLGQRCGDRQAEPGRAAGDQGDLPGPGCPRLRGRRACGQLVMAGLAAHTGMIAEPGRPGPQIPVTPPAARRRDPGHAAPCPLIAAGFCERAARVNGTRSARAANATK